MATGSIDRQHRGDEGGGCIHCNATGFVLDSVETTSGDFERVEYLCHECMPPSIPSDVGIPVRETKSSSLAIARRVEVESFTTPGRFYTVDTERGTCTCPHFDFRLYRIPGAECKHTRKARRESGEELRYEIREVHNSRLNGHFDNTEFRLVELRGDEEIRTVSVSYSLSGAYLDKIEAEGIVI